MEGGGGGSGSTNSYSVAQHVDMRTGPRRFLSCIGKGWLSAQIISGDSCALERNRHYAKSRGRRKIEKLFPRFNAEEVALTTHHEPEQQEQLATLLGSILRRVGNDD